MALNALQTLPATPTIEPRRQRVCRAVCPARRYMVQMRKPCFPADLLGLCRIGGRGWLCFPEGARCRGRDEISGRLQKSWRGNMAASKLTHIGVTASALVCVLCAAPSASGQTPFPSFGSAVSGWIDNTGSLTGCKCFYSVGTSLPSFQNLSDSANGAVSSSDALANLGTGFLSASAVSGRESHFTAAVAGRSFGTP